MLKLNQTILSHTHKTQTNTEFQVDSGRVLGNMVTNTEPTRDIDPIREPTLVGLWKGLG